MTRASTARWSSSTRFVAIWSKCASRFFAVSSSSASRALAASTSEGPRSRSGGDAGHRPGVAACGGGGGDEAGVPAAVARSSWFGPSVGQSSCASIRSERSPDTSNTRGRLTAHPLGPAKARAYGPVGIPASDPAILGGHGGQPRSPRAVVAPVVAGPRARTSVSPGETRKERSMEVRRYLSIVRRRALLILAIIAASIAAGYLVTPKQKTYTATSHDVRRLGSRSTLDPRSGQVNAGVPAGHRAAHQHLPHHAQEQQGRTRRHREHRGRADDERGRGTRSPRVQPLATNLISLSVTDSDPATARALANGVAETFDGADQRLPADRELRETSSRSSSARTCRRSRTRTT